MVFMKYNLRMIRHTIEANGQFEKGTNTSVIAINTNLTAEQARITIAHELAHFFYQYELDNHAERITTRYNSIDVRDKGSQISEMIAHIVGLYGAVIQQYTNKAMEILWR